MFFCPATCVGYNSCQLNPDGVGEHVPVYQHVFPLNPYRERATTSGLGRSGNSDTCRCFLVQFTHRVNPDNRSEQLKPWKSTVGFLSRRIQWLGPVIDVVRIFSHGERWVMSRSGGDNKKTHVGATCYRWSCLRAGAQATRFARQGILRHCRQGKNPS